MSASILGFDYLKRGKPLLILLAALFLAFYPVITSRADTESSIRAIEKEISVSPIEIAVFIDADTGLETARVTGTRYGITDSFLDNWYAATPGTDRLKEIAAYRDKVITHNHPDGDMMPSAADVWGAALLNARQMRVTGIENGKQITCVLSRGKLAYWPNYPYTKTDRDTWNQKASPAFFRSLGYGYSCLALSLKSG